MNAIVVNDLSISTELDSQTLTKIVGGTSVYYENDPWKYLGSKKIFKGFVKKGHKWYRAYLRIRKYKRCQYKYVKDCVYI